MSNEENYKNSQKLLNRKDTMYLSVINSQDAKIIQFKKLYTQRDWSTNLYNLDIESAQPKKYGIFTNKIDFINKVDDIEKASPRSRYFKLNKPQYNLSNEDIEKSSPSINYFKTKRNTNPLQPKYNLPELESYPLDIPKFIRDSIDIKDISGASPKKRFGNSKQEIHTEKQVNIDGSHPRAPYFRKNLGHLKYDYMDYSDINEHKFKSKRTVNTLDPIYAFRKEGEEKSNYYGPIEKSKPVTNYPYYYKPALNLKIDDIKGSNPGSLNYIKKFKGKDYELYSSDIPKTNAGSLKKGITTSRCLNPLLPEYQYLGQKEEQFGYKNAIRLQKKQDFMPLISNNNDIKENEKSKENIVSNINNDNELEKINENNNETNKVNENVNNKNNILNKKKLFDRMSKFKINKFNINIVKKENKLKKCNSAMNLLNKDMKLENINNEKGKKMIRFTPLLKSKGKELINNTNISFDKTKFGKKPDPFYGYIHDPTLLSKDSKERLENIEKAKFDRELNKKIYENFIFNKNNNYIAEEYKKNPNDNNLIFISDNPSLVQRSLIHRKNIDEWCNLNKIEKRRLPRLRSKSKSLMNLAPIKKLNPEKLDGFLNINNIQKSVEDRYNYSNLTTLKINPSEFTKKALLE